MWAGRADPRSAWNVAQTWRDHRRDRPNGRRVDQGRRRQERISWVSRFSGKYLHFGQRGSRSWDWRESPGPIRRRGQTRLRRDQGWLGGGHGQDRSGWGGEARVATAADGDGRRARTRNPDGDGWPPPRRPVRVH